MERFVISEIALRVSLICNVPIKWLRSSSRKTQHVRARNLAIYISRMKTDASLEEIGFVFNRSYSAVLHAINSVEKDRRLIKFAKFIHQKIENGAP